MDKKSLDELLNTLGLIALIKSMLPFPLRGWVSSLGLYVEERKAGRLSRLQAGGSLRSYLDAWQEDEGEWEVRKFDEATWEHRFVHVVEPTSEIAEFLSERVANFGDLDSQGAAALNEALQHYKSTGQWLGLPKVPEEVKVRRAQAEGAERKMKEREKRLSFISQMEKEVAADPLARTPSLPDLYYLEERYKDMEHALQRALEADASKLGFQYSSTYKELGKLYW